MKVVKHPLRFGRRRRHERGASVELQILRQVSRLQLKAKKVVEESGRVDILERLGLQWPLQLQVALLAASNSNKRGKMSVTSKKILHHPLAELEH
jgi:hypothetical protein